VRARELLARNDGLRLVDGTLRLNERAATQTLQEIIAQVLANQRGGGPSLPRALRVTRPSGAADLGLVVRAVPRNQWSEGKSVPSVAIFVSDPDQQSEAPQAVITQLFGFTPTEATLALLLVNGLTLDEASAELGVSRNTARTHLRSVFAKTGVSRQTLLVRLILKSVAPLAQARN
jgi:DNA-binding CsgD family transcriptional regulator